MTVCPNTCEGTDRLDTYSLATNRKGTIRSGLVFLLEMQNLGVGNSWGGEGRCSIDSMELKHFKIIAISC